MRDLIILIAITGCLQAVHSKRVVVVPMPNISHTRYLTNLARALSVLGHEIWVCMPVSVAEQSVLDMTGIHTLLYSRADVNTVEKYMRYVRDAYWEDKNVDMPKMMDILYKHIEAMMMDTELEATIKKLKPDLMVIDNLPHMSTISVLAYKLDIPFAFVGSLYNPIPYRVPFTTATFPSVLFPHSHHMTFSQRLLSFVIYGFMTLFEIFSFTDAVRRYAPEKPYLPIRELTAKAEIVLIESDPILDYPKVSLPNVKLIGGTGITKAKPLVEPFKSFVESAKTPVLVVAFGSYILEFPEEISNKLLTAFQQLQIKIIWRINMTSPNPQKILTANWIPQNDLLGHPNVKVFVTHCGQSSQYEALFHGVPTLCMPIFLDQTYNAERARLKGYGLTLDIKEATSDDIVSFIREIQNNSTYTANVKKGSKLFKINYGLPMDNAAFWLDHIMQYGGDYIRSAGQNMPGYQFYCLDVLAIILIFLGILSFCVAYLVKMSINWIMVLATHFQYNFIRKKIKVS